MVDDTLQAILHIPSGEFVYFGEIDDKRKIVHIPGVLTSHPYPINKWTYPSSIVEVSAELQIPEAEFLIVDVSGERLINTTVTINWE